MRKQGSKHKKKILSGHKRVGKRFIPPMKQIPMATDTSYITDMLPELIWIGLINERVGYVRGAGIIEKVFLTVDTHKEKGQEGNFALLSSFNKLTTNQKIAITGELHGLGILDIIQHSVAPLVLLYNDCPFRFLGPPTTSYSQEDLIEILKQCTKKVIDRYATAGIVLYGSMLLARLVTKTIHFPADMDLPDFNSVINSPGSEEAKRAAGFMRANGLAEFGMMKINNKWAKHFWDHNFELSPCEFI
ncbi:MAG: hypothetical protein KZQ75_10415 [Candidatus Thiodiazotropha sp. (ex Myrtea spinifera)]|nr:hypothetical protein [Candidatus Thiodiazotropha sp. (ex Myrtea spinifera)]